MLILFFIISLIIYYLFNLIDQKNMAKVLNLPPKWLPFIVAFFFGIFNILLLTMASNNRMDIENYRLGDDDDEEGEYQDSVCTTARCDGHPVIRGKPFQYPQAGFSFTPLSDDNWQNARCQ